MVKKACENKVKRIEFFGKFLGIGWTSKLIFKRATAYFSINKLVVDGCDLERGDEICSYLAEDEKGRKVIISYVDGKKVKGNTNKFKV